MNIRNNLFNRISGQALPVGIALFFVLGVTSFVLFNTGQTVTSKTRLVNTADSAAYSGMLWQARAMNFTAYTNRAMVANQVAMAQAVSLNSWSAYLSKSTENLDDMLGSIPYVGAVTGALKAIASVVDIFLNPISQGMLQVVNAVNAGLTIAQEAMFYSTFIATSDVVASVVKSNDVHGHDFDWVTGFSVMNAGANIYQWKNLTDQFEKTDQAAMMERKRMIEASMDGFSRDRSWKFLGMYFPISWNSLARIEKAGNTQLFEKDGEWEWQANDALSLRMMSLRLSWRGLKISYDDLGIGGGSAIANPDNSNDSITGTKQDLHPGRHDPAKNRGWQFHKDRKMSGYGGMHAYRALTEEWRESEESPKLKLRVEVKLDPRKIINAKEFTEDPTFSNDIGVPGNVFSSVSSAELYFERPCLEDASCTTEEYADSYSPYWDVRLTENTGVARLAAYALHNFGGHLDDDNSEFINAKIHDLSEFGGKRATPVDDYKEQYNGVRRTLSSMDHHLLTIAKNSDEYRAYEAKVESIRTNIQGQVDNIAADFLKEQYSKEELAEAMIKAAGYDFDMDEYKAFKGEVDSLYGEMIKLTDLDALEDEIAQFAKDTLDDLKKEIEEALADLLAEAVKRIMMQLAVNALGTAAGVDLDMSVVDNVVDDEIEKILNTKVQSDDGTVAEFDLNDECAFYEQTNASEMLGTRRETRRQEIFESIVNDFASQLITTSDDFRLVHGDYELERSEIIDLIGKPRDLTSKYYVSPWPNDEPTYEQQLTNALENIDQKIAALPGQRVEALTDELMRISEEKTAGEPGWEEFKLERADAKETVKALLLDPDDIALDGNGKTAGEILFTAEVQNEQESDLENDFTAKPGHC